ncbi:MAG TPA: ThuA domain-containing protein [Solirubrobacteraceae bacterium]|nr:ThuA domain-containing protein [Solirubrobacteraceae bacterium]
MGLSRWTRAVVTLAVVLPAFAAASANASTLSSDEPVPLGSRADAPTWDDNLAGMPEAWQYTAASSGPVDAVNVRLDRRFNSRRQSAANARLIAGIYADANGQPGALLGKGILNSFDHNAWNTVPITAVAVEKGKKYWIAVMGRGEQITLKTNGGGIGSSPSATGPRNQTDLPSSYRVDRVFPKDGPAAMYAVERYSVLVFTKGATGNVTAGVAALRALPDAAEVTFDVTDDATKFTDANLAKYRAVVFLNNAGELLDGDQQSAFEKYFKTGGGFLGIHSAIEAEPDWQFMSDLLGTRAEGRTDALDATIKVADRVHVASKGLPEYWSRNDRWYNFTGNVRGFSHVLATVDENTYTGGTDGFDHPIAWCKDYQGGRSFYTGGGGTDATYGTTSFRRHLEGALDWTAGKADKVYSDCGATVWANYQQTKIAAPPNINEPIGFDQLPDGRIMQTVRDGRIRIHDPLTGTSTVIAQIPVYQNSEDGLYGPAFDRNFEQNHWVYFYYAPVNLEGISNSGSPYPPQTPAGDAPTAPQADPSFWDNWKGYFQLSRFKFVDGPSPTIDMASEQKIMKVEVNRGACCHVAGDIDFDKHNNLWMTTGDDTPATAVGANNNPPQHDMLTNENQTIAVANATGGTFTLTFDGQTTAPIAFPLVNTDIEAALEALSNIDDVAVTGTGTRTVNFRANQQQKDVPQMTADASGLTGTAPTVTIATTLQGGLFQAPFNDARRSSTNTNDLRGKLLRIKVKDGDISEAEANTIGGSYTVPSGNLFAPGTPKTRPEIYAMGFRNPFRLQIDEDDVAYIADYSPDSQSPTGLRAAQGTGRIEIVRKPSNYGWPMCYKTDLPMYKWDFNTQTTLGETYECNNPNHGPVNPSRWNTGLTDGGPPITNPDVWYSYRDDLWGTPCINNYNVAVPVQGSCPLLFPELRSPNSNSVGPHLLLKYDYEEDNPSTTKFPPYFDDAVFFGEWTRDYLREIRIDSNNNVQKINDALSCGGVGAARALAFGFECDGPMDAQFGADGNLYLLTYGNGFFVQSAQAGMYRWSYVKGQRAPNAVMNANRTDGPAPLTVQYSSEGTRDPDPGDALTFSWDFDGNGSVDSTDPNPTYTYTQVGVYTARLVVRDPAGNSDVKTLTITVGNTSPTVTINTPVDGDFFEWGESIPYTVTVTDPEDGPIDCNRVQVTFSLVHDQHAHAGETKAGCSGVLATNPNDAQHGGSIAAGVSASYTDLGANGQPPLTGVAQVVVQNRIQQIEFVQEQNGTNAANTNDPTGGGQHRTGIDPGDWIALDRRYYLGNMDKKIRFRYAGGSAANPAGNDRMAVEIHSGSQTGPIITTVTLKSTGTNNNTWSTQEFDLDFAGSQRLFLVFRSVTGGPTTGMGNINWVGFSGTGWGVPAGP